MPNPFKMPSFLAGFQTEAFPKDGCVHPDTREEGVFHSAEMYICVLADPKRQTSLRIAHLMPYITEHAEQEGVYLYGWTDGHSVRSLGAVCAS